MSMNERDIQEMREEGCKVRDRCPECGEPDLKFIPTHDRGNTAVPDEYECENCGHTECAESS